MWTTTAKGCIAIQIKNSLAPRLVLIIIQPFEKTQRTRYSNRHFLPHFCRWLILPILLIQKVRVTINIQLIEQNNTLAFNWFQTIVFLDFQECDSVSLRREHRSFTAIAFKSLANHFANHNAVRRRKVASKHKDVKNRGGANSPQTASNVVFKVR